MGLITTVPVVAESATENWDDGSFAAPSARFAAEPTTGFYRNASGEIGFAKTLFSTRADFSSGTSHIVLKIETDTGEFATIGAGKDGSTNRTLEIKGPGGTNAFRWNSALVDVSGNVRFRDNKELGFGPISLTTTPPLTAIDWSTPQTNDGPVWGLADANTSLVFCQFSDRNNDLAVPNVTEPSLFMLDAAATANTWTKIDHDGLDTGSANDLLLRSNTQVGMTIRETGAAALISFYPGIAPVARQTVVGGWVGNAAGKNLAVALGLLGIINDGTAA